MKRNLVGKILGKIKIFVQDFVPIRTALTDRASIADGSVEFCEATPIGLVDEPKVSLYGRETDHLRSACRCVA